MPLVEAYGKTLEFPDDMSHEDMANVIRKNEHLLNPNYKPPKSSSVREFIQDNILGFDISRKPSIAEQAEATADEGVNTAASEVKGAPVRQSSYNKALLNNDIGSQESSGVLARTRKAADEDVKGQDFQRELEGLRTDGNIQESPSGVTGLLGNVITGAKQTGRMAAATVSALANDNKEVEGIAKESNLSAEENTPTEQKALLGDLRKINREQGALDQISDTLKSAANNPMGTGQMVAEQLPNTAVSLASGFAGFKAGGAAGAVFGPIGATIGGTLGFVSGMFLGNVLLEAGGKAIEKASDEDGFTPEDRDSALREGAVKAGVITGVDAAMFKLGGMLARKIGASAINAGARAEAKVLIDAGVDATSLSAINAALKSSPELLKAAKVAGERAALQSLSTGRKAAILGTGAALETVGEFVGEAGGEYAATGKADYVDATIEALSSATMSIAETAYNYNKVASGNDLSPVGIQKAVNSINDAETKSKINDIRNAATVDQAINVANESVSQKPVDKDDVLRVADPTLADIERLTGLKPSETLQTAQEELQRQSQAAQQNIATGSDIEPSQTLRKTASWVIVDKNNNEALFETYDKNKVDALNTERYKAVPILEYLQGLNKNNKGGQPSGSDIEIVLPDNKTLKARWDVVDADNVKASLKNGVSQPRDRTRAASDVQIREIANQPDYRRLADSPVMDIGAPVISNDGQIVGGNGRFEALSRAYDQGTHKDYLERLKQDAINKGIDPAILDTMRKPVLVRRISEPFDTRQLAIASNSGMSAVYSDLEQAKIDAERLKGIDEIITADNGDIVMTGDNVRRVRDALGGYNAAEMASFVDDQGQLSQQGVKRIRNAMLAKAYGDNPVLGKIIESTDSDIKTILGSLTRVAGDVVKARSTAPKESDITPNLLDAINIFSQLKQKGQSVTNYLSQQDAFTEQLDPVTENVLLFLDKNSRSQPKVTQYIRDAYTRQGAIDATSPDIFGQEPPKVKDIFAKPTIEEELEKHLKKNGYNFDVRPIDQRDINALDDTKKAQKDIAEKQAKIFNKKIVFVKAKGEFGINGVMVPAIKDTIFINIETPKPFHAVMAHELSHWMEQEHPSVYKDMLGSLKDVIVNEEGYRKKYGITEQDEGLIQKEIAADLMGDNFTDETFWNKVAAANPDKWKEIANRIVQWLKNAILKAKSRGMGSEDWVTDAKKAQDIIANAVAQYTKQQDAVGKDIKFHKAFHGSPHDHNKFDSSKIGTGEGAQAYGYGHYFAESRDVAEWYKKKLSKKYKDVHIEDAIADGVISNEDIVSLRDKLGGEFKRKIVSIVADKDGYGFYHAYYLYDNGVKEELKMFPYDDADYASIEEFLSDIDNSRVGQYFLGDNAVFHQALRNGIFVPKSSGKLYEVELAPEQDEYLLWDKPLSEQSEKVKNALSDYMQLNPNVDILGAATGRDIYDTFVKQNVKRETAGGVTTLDYDKAQKPASAMLHFLGIRGIKYLDGSSRAKGEGAYNYVIFDDKDIEIKAKFSKQEQEGKDNYRLRTWIPVPRSPGWTQAKIIRALKSKAWSRALGKSNVLKEIAKFDSAKEFEDHIYYHGTANHLGSSLVPSITMSEAQAERSGGGGYGERYWAISLSKSKDIASNFTGQSRYGNVYGVILKKGANVQEIPGIQDAADIEDHIVQLWNDGVDAVRIGGGEEELAVLNPYAIVRYANGESFQVFQKKKFEPLTTDQIENIYNVAKEYAEKRKNTPAEERKNIEVPEIRFSKQQIPGTIKELEELWDAKGISNFISEKNGVITLSKIVIPKEQRNNGIGTSAMNELISYADKTGQRIALSPSSDFGGSKSRLLSFYKRFGFVENRGKNKDYSISESMYRDSSIQAQVKDISSQIPETLTIDGTERPTRNSEGKLIHPTEEGIRNFWKWFQNSEVTDKQGRPKVVYHGTDKEFQVFDKSISDGLWFTDNKESLFNDEAGASGSGIIIEAYLKAENLLLNGPNSDIEDISEDGYDGVENRYDYGIDYAVINPNQIKSAIGNTGEFSEDNNDIRFSQQNQFNPNEDIPETFARKIQRKFQDKFNRFNVVKEYLEKEEGIKISENADVYGAEERYHAKVANQHEDFRNKVRNPLTEKIAKAGYKLDDVEQYLLNRHAQEANLQNRKLTGKDDSTAYGISDEDAKEYLAKAPKELAKLADEIQAITKATQQLRLDNGIENQERIDAMNAAYQYYVPVRGGAEEQAKQQGYGKGLSVKYKPKRRLGHELRNESVIENIFQDYERAIIEVEKNRVGKSLALMAAEIQMTELISINQPEKRKVLRNEKAYGVLVKGELQDVFQTEEAAKQNRQLLVATDKKLTLSDVTIAPITDQRLIYSASPMLADNEVLVYMDGHEVRLQINDELLAQAYKNMGMEPLGSILSVGRAINGWMSKVYTAYNPEFFAVNVLRDFTSGMINLTGEQGIGISAKAIANYPKAFLSLLKYATTGQSDKWIDAYRDNGGNTGAAYLSDLERLGEEVRKEYASYQGVIANLKEKDVANALRAAGRKVFNATIRYMENLNQSGENAFRLATFKAMVESGKSAKESGSMAKNVTVNFNRKGEVGAQMNALYLFFNASIQGTAAASHALFKGRNKYQAWGLAGSMMTLGYIAASMLGGFDDEDEYDSISDFVKSRNLIISYGDGYVKIPVPYGHGFFYNAGRMYAEAQRKDEIGKLPYQLAALATEEFSPFNIAQSEDSSFDSRKVTYGLIPTAIRIPVEITNNYSTFTGRELYPEKAWYKSEPDNEKMFRGTKGTVYDVSAQYLASIGVEISPETLKYLSRTATGGAGAFIDSTVSAAMLKKQGAELDTREIPFVRKFYGEATIQDARARYNKAKEEAREAYEKFNALRKKNDLVSVRNYLNDKKELIALNSYANKISDVIKNIRDQQDLIKLSEDFTVAEKRLKIKELEKQEEYYYDLFLNRHKQVKGR